MIQLILVGLILGIFFTLSVITLPIAWLIGKINPHAKDMFSYVLVSKTLSLVMFATGSKVEIRGKENIPAGQPVLFVGNHRSFFDIVLNYSIIPPLMGFISKIEIKKVPLLAQWMVNMNCLFLDRSDPKEGIKMIKNAVAKLENGISIFIFPEGTRAKTDEAMAEFKGGSLKIAQKANVPIIPVAVNNTSAIFEDHFPYIRKSHIIVEYCKPVILSDLSKEEQKFLASKVENIIRDKVMANKNDL